MGVKKAISNFYHLQETQLKCKHTDQLKEGQRKTYHVDSN